MARPDSKRTTPALFLGAGLDLDLDWTVFLTPFLTSTSRTHSTARRPSQKSRHSSLGMLQDGQRHITLRDRPARKDKLSRPRHHASKHFKAEKATSRRSAPLPTRKLSSLADIDISNLSSDSSLTDVPDDIGPDPFKEDPATPTKVKIVKVKRPSKSPYFPNKPRPHFLACLPFPPLSDSTFGLMQEKLAHNPFRLLIATIFLNKTPGARAMPVFYQLMKMYPTPTDLANAEVADVTTIIHHLGFQNQRARKCVEMAKMWVERPPMKGKRTRKLHYPVKGDGRDLVADEVVEDDDPRVAWEISHLPGLGPYSHDSWRMFCRDELRGLATSWLGEGAQTADFEPEWKRVVPTDKELRAYLTWVWLKEGWIWNKETGQRVRADETTLQNARGGGVIKEESDKAQLVIIGDMEAHVNVVEKPAGDFIPPSATKDTEHLDGRQAI